MKALVFAMAAVPMVLAACAGIESDDDSPSITYTVPRSYQTVYLRAQNQADECLRGHKAYDVYAQVNPALQTGVVSVRGPLGDMEVARTELKALDPSHTEVTQQVWGHGPWNQEALEAMRQSVLMDMSLCTSYMRK